MKALISRNQIRYFVNFPYILVYLTFLIRIFSLIDFTDEMQYYLQINELNNNDFLFQSDLYIQQLIYVIFYPLNKLYFFLFESKGLVVFNRIILTILFLLLMFFAKKIFILHGSSKRWSNWTSALLCLMPSIGIYAISYNTICFIGISLFLLMLARNWDTHDIITVSLIILFTAISNPSIGVLIFVISSIRLFIRKDKVFFLNYLLILSSLFFILIIFFTRFTNYEDIISSLNFSNGFGVGQNWLKQYYFWPMILIYIYGSFRVVFRKKIINWNNILASKAISFLSLICSSIIVLTELMAYFLPLLKQNDNLLQRVIVLYILFLIALISQISFKIAKNIKLSYEKKQWILISIPIFVLGVSLTSSDGFGMATHIFLISIPICLGFSGGPSSIKVS